MYWKFVILLSILMPLMLGETIVYNVPKHYAQQTGHAAFRYKDDKIEITFNENNINLTLFNDSRILFASLNDIETYYDGEVLAPYFKTNATVTDNLEAYAELMAIKLDEYETTNWRVHLSQFIKIDEQIPVIYETTIRKVVEVALEEYFATKYAFVKASEMQNTGSIEDTCMIPIPPTISLSDSSRESTQLLANKVVDKLMADAKVRFLSETDVVPVPAMDLLDIVNPHVIIKLERLILYDGKMRGMKDLIRLSDGIVTKDGDKYELTTSVIATNLQLNFSHITISLGLVHNGNLNITVNVATLKIVATFDESVTPCQLKINRLEPIDIGRIGYSLDGFGALDTAAAWVFKSVVEAIKYQTAYILTTNIRYVGQSLLDTIDCEKLGIARV